MFEHDKLPVLIETKVNKIEALLRNAKRLKIIIGKGTENEEKKALVSSSDKRF
jgi:hypothetical protein